MLFRSFVIDGIRQNIPFLSSLMQNPRWRNGDLSTGFIAEEYPEGFSSPAPTGDVAWTLAAVATLMRATFPLLAAAEIEHVVGPAN